MCVCVVCGVFIYARARVCAFLHILPCCPICHLTQCSRRYAIDLYTDQGRFDDVDRLTLLRDDYRSKAYRKPGRRRSGKERPQKKWVSQCPPTGRRP